MTAEHMIQAVRERMTANMFALLQNNACDPELSMDEAISLGRDVILTALAPLIAEWSAERQWQPIATAPKDGTWVLVMTTHWPHAEVSHWGNTFSSVETFAWTNDEYTCKPTHWQPLPSPPADGTKAQP
jgi:hypothetical protein